MDNLINSCGIKLIILFWHCVSGYYHQVSSYGTQNIAVSLLFSRLDGVSNIDFTGCDQALSSKPLSEMDVDWKFPGHGNLSMGNTDVETVRYSWDFIVVTLVNTFENGKTLGRGSFCSYFIDCLQPPFISSLSWTQGPDSIDWQYILSILVKLENFDKN